MNDETQTFLERFAADSEKMKQAAPKMVQGFGALFASVMKDSALKV